MKKLYWIFKNPSKRDNGELIILHHKVQYVLWFKVFKSWMDYDCRNVLYIWIMGIMNFFNYLHWNFFVTEYADEIEYSHGLEYSNSIEYSNYSRFLWKCGKLTLSHLQTYRDTFGTFWVYFSYINRWWRIFW